LESSGPVEICSAYENPPTATAAVSEPREEIEAQVHAAINVLNG
jgi:hypothetical protein